MMDVISTLKDVPTWVYLLIFLMVLLYNYFTWNFDYWKKRGIPGNKPYLFMGTLKPTWIYAVEVDDVNCVSKYGRIFGGFEGTTPVLFITDPELIRQVTIKDFTLFPNRRKFPGSIKTEYIKLSLPDLENDEWRSIRNTLSPAFTTGKLKQMIHIIEECVGEMTKSMENKADKGEPLEMTVEFALLTLSVIASCAFGMKIDGMNDPHCEFVKRARTVFRATPMLTYLTTLFPKAFEKLPRSIINSPFEYFSDVASRAIDLRLQNKDSGRRDFIQILLEAEIQNQDDTITSESKTKNSKLTRDSIIGQVIIFLVGGFEAIATSLALTAYELAMNPDIQNKLIAEIDDVVTECKGNVTHEIIARMQYLDMVISETLRLHPAAHRFERICEQDGTSLNGIILNRGDMTIVPVYALHHDPEFYPNPEVFDPNRFSPENKAKRNPFTYLPFGAGPRNCIAMRFALMQIKIVTVHILTKFRFQTWEKTEFPLKFNRGFGVRSAVSVNLMLQKRIDQPHFND